MAEACDYQAHKLHHHATANQRDKYTANPLGQEDFRSHFGRDPS